MATALSVTMVFAVVTALLTSQEVGAGPVCLACLATCFSCGPCCLYCLASLCGVCFHDDTTMTKISEACVDLSVGEMGPGCFAKVPVMELAKGDAVLTQKDSQHQVTHVARNERHVGNVDGIQMEVALADGRRQITTTANHVMIVYQDASLAAPTFANARAVVVGDVVSVDGMPGRVTSVHAVGMDHRNHLVTTDGTVLANGVLVTTMCEEYGGGAYNDVPATLASWQRNHSQFIL